MFLTESATEPTRSTGSAFKNRLTTELWAAPKAARGKMESVAVIIMKVLFLKRNYVDIWLSMEAFRKEERETEKIK